MKHLFTFLILLLSISGFSQRITDLDVKIISPLTPFAVDTNETFDLEVLVTNLGPDMITANDSLFFYLIINGDTVQFPPQGNFQIYQNAIPSGQSYTIIKPMAFNSSYEGSSVSFCAAVYPRNSASPVNDGQGSNNKSCITVEVGEQEVIGVDEKELAAVEIFPNPAIDKINFNTEEEIVSIRVIDITGNLVLSQSGSRKSINCLTFSDGIYYVFVETDKGETVEKIIVQRN